MIGFILGTAYDAKTPLGLELAPDDVSTPFGTVVVHRVVGREAVVLFRHGQPHRWLPNQIPYRAHALALARIGVTTLVITSSVGVLDPAVPLHVPLLVEDLLMLENRLPTGDACTMFDASSPSQGHLVLDDGLCSSSLGTQIEVIAASSGTPIARRVVFGYAQGPRTKTPAENRALRLLGADVNSMTVGPELVLANELEIATAALVIGHKYSVPSVAVPDDLQASLDHGRAAFDRLLRHLVDELREVPFGNRIHRFGQ